MGDNPIKDFVAGAAYGTLDWTTDKIKDYVDKFRNREVGFVGDMDTVRELEDDRKSSEYRLYQKYIDDRELKILVQMGIRLRKLQDQQERVENLRTKIHHHYGVRGLHIAQFVQNGILKSYISVLIDEHDDDYIKRRIVELMNNIEKITIFVHAGTPPEKIAEKIRIKADAINPIEIIVFGYNTAKAVVKKALEIMDDMPDYDIHIEEERIKITVIMKKNT